MKKKRLDGQWNTVNNGCKILIYANKLSEDLQPNNERSRTRSKIPVRLLLLGWHHRSQPADVAYIGNMVMLFYYFHVKLSGVMPLKLAAGTISPKMSAS